MVVPKFTKTNPLVNRARRRVPTEFCQIGFNQKGRLSPVHWARDIYVPIYHEQWAVRRTVLRFFLEWSRSLRPDTPKSDVRKGRRSGELETLALPMTTAAHIMFASPNSVDDKPATWPDGLFRYELRSANASLVKRQYQEYWANPQPNRPWGEHPLKSTFC